MTKEFFKDAFGWGFLLWLIGYALGMVFFSIVPAHMIGYFVSPIGIVITLWVLIKKLRGDNMIYYLKVAVVWVVIAVVCDYLFLVRAFNYFYYTLTFVLPLLAGIFKTKKQDKFLAFLRIRSQTKEKNKQKILESIEAQKSITNDAVENLLLVSDATATRYLDELEKEGKIKQVGKTGKGVFYEKA